MNKNFLVFCISMLMTNQIFAFDNEEQGEAGGQMIQWIVLPYEEQPQVQYQNCVHYAFRNAIANGQIEIGVVDNPRGLIL